jgi:hypothetical protein
MMKAAVALTLAALTLGGEGARSVSGKVTDRRGNVLPGAVVQIENTVTLEIQSYIVHEDGEYHFKDLNPDVEFTLHAQYHQHLSKKVTLSRFDGRKDVKIDLMIPIE